MQHEATKQLYAKDWVYNFEEYLWFYKPNFNDQSALQFFNIKKWETSTYQYEVRKDQFAKLDDFDSYLKIKENAGNSP